MKNIFVMLFACSFLLPRALAQGSDTKWQKIFQIARSVNKNLVVYEAGIVYESSEKAGKPAEAVKPHFIDKGKPIKIYWVLNEKNGKTQELSKIEEELAYGIKITKSDRDNVEFSLKPLPKKAIKLTLRKEKNGWKVVPLALVNGEECVLTDIFINAKKAFPLPKVNYIDLKGVSVKTNKEYFERIASK